MRFTRRLGRDRVSLPDITSMVDVVFLLIIFFLTTSTLVRATVSEVDLAEQPGNREAQLEERGLVVNVSQAGDYVVEGATVSLERLLSMIESEAAKQGGVEDLEVLVRADRNALLRPVNEFAAGLIDLGVRDWKLATRATAPVPDETRPGGGG